MARFAKGSVFDGLGLLDATAFVCFCSSVPLLLPVFDLWRGMISSDPAAWLFFSSASFSNSLCLSAMFTALAFLFACLLRTGHARVGRGLIVSALGCYVAGYVLIILWSYGVVEGWPIEMGCGLTMGYGGAVISLFWASHLRFSGFKAALRAVWVVGCVVFANFAFLTFFGNDAVRVVLGTEALVSVVGCTRVLARFGSEDERPTQADANWWDVFGHLDISVVEGTEDFKAPLARALFFAVAPFAVLLLFVANVDLVRTVQWGVHPLAAGSLIAVAGMALLLRMKSDQALINFSYRFFLPLVAFASFVATAFVDFSVQHAVMVVGAFSFCTVYALVMSAMLVSMAGRMRSLALPAAGIMVIIACLVCILSDSEVGFDVLAAYRYRILIVLFAAVVVVLAITPSARLWRVMLDGIDAVESSALDKQEGYLRRCAELADSCRLTAREAEILVLLGRGHTSGFVARELTVAESTVRSHRKNIYRKLEVSSREELFGLLDDKSSK